MPNGRSGGFYLKREELEQLLKGCEDHVQVGKAIRRRLITTADLKEILSRWTDDEVPIEEQDGTWYIIQFEDTNEWVVVNTESPLFDGLRHYHAEWRKEWANRHPHP